MRERRIHGNSKNYVLLFYDGAVMTCRGRTYPYSTEAPSPVAADTNMPPPVRLIHKRNLWSYTSPTFARQFWRFGRACEP